VLLRASKPVVSLGYLSDQPRAPGAVESSVLDQAHQAAGGKRATAEAKDVDLVAFRILIGQERVCIPDLCGQSPPRGAAKPMVEASE
jgi:hypothetical protein